MQSHWSDAEAARVVKTAGTEAANQELALRVYTSQLIGQEQDLVLHGGGNTSVKVKRRDATGAERYVIHVKGSGWDLATIEAPGLPGMWLEPLLAARETLNMTDERMVTFLRSEMLDQHGPTPSVEALLHAFLPQPYVDHTHSAAALVIANQPQASKLAREIFSDRLCLVPYVMPGFKLSHAADEIFRGGGTSSEGLFLNNHGLFSFGEDAKTSYERILRFTTMCEEYLIAQGATLAPPETGTKIETHPPAVLALGRALREWDIFSDDPVLDLRSSSTITRYLSLPNLENVANRGTATPDHVIRIKPRPVLGAAGFSAADWGEAIKDYVDWYTAYFDRNALHADEPKTMLDPLPRVALLRGCGIVGIGRNSKEAGVAADLAEQTARIVLSAEALGEFAPLGEAELFKMEYWSLEQAKLRKEAEH